MLPQRVARVALEHSTAQITAVRRRRRCFQFDGEKYPYVVRRHTWDNERTVELALALRFLRQHPGQAVLELGNVTRQYGFGVPDHLVVDKYELGQGVENIDFVDFEPPTTFPLVLSLSTIEHVGFDEAVDDPKKPLVVADKLRRCVAPGGSLLVTLPFAYNQRLDADVRSGAFADLHEVRFLKRVSRDNRWEEVDLHAVAGARYGTPFPKANAIAVWRWHSSD